MVYTYFITIVWRLLSITVVNTLDAWGSSELPVMYKLGIACTVCVILTNPNYTQTNTVDRL